MRKKPEYRALTERDLSDGERQAVYGRRDAAEAARYSHDGLIAAARSDRPGFRQHARWFVVTCRSGTEMNVSDSLTKAGIDSWCPLDRKRRPPRRGLPAVEIWRPAFHGYLFVCVIPDDAAFVGLMRAAKLNGFMGFGGRPYPVPDEMIAQLQLNWKKHEKKHIDTNDLEALKTVIGKPAVVRSGPFADFAVTVRRLLAKDRKFVVNVSMFGKMHEVRIPVDSFDL